MFCVHCLVISISYVVRYCIHKKLSGGFNFVVFTDDRRFMKKLEFVKFITIQEKVAWVL